MALSEPKRHDNATASPVRVTRNSPAKIYSSSPTCDHATIQLVVQTGPGAVLGPSRLPSDLSRPFLRVLVLHLTKSCRFLFSIPRPART